LGAAQDACRNLPGGQNSTKGQPAGKASDPQSHKGVLGAGRLFMDSAIEKVAMRKVYLRLLPLTMLMYFLCYIDRINVSFAALTMTRISA
jgi:hypothetical protein